MRLSLILWILFFNACKGQEESMTEVHFEIDSILKLERKEFQSPYSVTMHYRQAEQLEYLSVYNHGAKEIISYAMNTGKIVEIIPVKHSWEDKVFAFRYVNKDSIFVLFNPNYRRGGIHDSILVRIDHHGTIKDAYSFKNAPVHHRENPYFDKDSMASVGMLELAYFNANIAFTLKREYCLPGDTLFAQYHFPIGGHFNTLDKTLTLHKIEHPSKKIGTYYANDANAPYLSLSAKGNPLYSFRHTDAVYEYDPKTQTNIKYTTLSVLIDSIHPLAMPHYISSNDRPSMDNTQPFYGRVVYDRYRDKYYRTLSIPSTTGGGYRQVLLVYNNDFQKIGEGVFPDSLGGDIIPTKNGLLIYHVKKSPNDQPYFVYSIGKLQYVPTHLSTYTSSFQQKGIETNTKKGFYAYLKEVHNLTIKNGAVIFLPLDKSCDACINYLIDFYKENHHNYKKTHFIIAAWDNNLIKNILKKHEVPPTINTLYMDGHSTYLKYFNYDRLEPTLFMIKNNQVETTKGLIPSELNNLPKYLSSYKR